MKRLALATALAAAALAGAAAVRPYEFDWANRTADDRPVLLPLVDAAGWTVSATNAVATFARADAHCLFGDAVPRLVYRGTGPDPRITLLTMFNTGLFTAQPGQAFGSMGSVQSEPKDQVFARLKVPIAYFVGGTDMARPNATDDYPYIENVPAFLAVREIEGDAHGGTFREEKGGAFGEAAVAWLDWNLKGKKSARAKFLGEDNMFDSDPLWIEYRHKNTN